MNKKHILYTIAFVFALVGALSRVVFAAEQVSTEVRYSSDDGRQYALVSIGLNSESEPVNAIEISGHFSPDVLTYDRMRDGNSVVNFWIEQPDRDAANNDGSFVASGIIPGGYAGIGTVATFSFEIKGNQPSLVHFDHVRSISGDGAIQHELGPITAEILPNTSGAGMRADTVAPETFTPLVARDAALFDGNWFVSFATQDKQSGIDQYLVAESAFPFPKFLKNSSWIKASSPHLLVDQSLRSYVYVRAIDVDGNSRTEKIAPGVFFSYWMIMLCVFFFIILIVAAIKWYNHSK